jgi:hypothetical protein
VDKANLTQFGRAMWQMGVEMIPAYSPEARGRSERAFRTHQERLPRELALHGIRTMEAANRYLSGHYRQAFNREFQRPAAQAGTAFIPWIGGNLDDILCERYGRTVSADNCVSFEGKSLQIPRDEHRCHYVKAKVRVHRYLDGSLGVFHGPRQLADYDGEGRLKKTRKKKKGKGKGGVAASRPPRSPFGGKTAPGYALRVFPAEAKSGQFICYKSGHFYLLLTQENKTCPAKIEMSGFYQSRNVRFLVQKNKLNMPL